MESESESGPMSGVEPFDRNGDGDFRGSGKECYVDECEGELYYSDEALVCGQCAAVTGLDITSRTVSVQKMGMWEEFHENPRAKYPNSGRVKLVGGFLSAYEWVSSDEHDGAVGELSGGEFYL